MVSLITLNAVYDLSKTLTYADTRRGKLQESTSCVEVQRDTVVLPQTAGNTNTSVTGMPWWSPPLFDLVITSYPVYCRSCNCKCQRTVIELLAPWQEKLYLNWLEKLYRIIPFLLSLFRSSALGFYTGRFSALRYLLHGTCPFFLYGIFSEFLQFHRNALNWDLQNHPLQITPSRKIPLQLCNYQSIA